MFASSSDQLPPQHQVFINFRGKELRFGFVSHLVHALKRDRINVFIDELESRGEDLNSLFTRIKESRIALVIFSSLYTESRWCLNELVKIKECADLGKLVAIPIFYKIKISHVKNLKGVFGYRLWKLARKSKKGDKWREAVEAVSRKFCIVVDGKRKESDCVDEIVGEVKKGLIRMSTDLEKEILEAALDPTPMVGIETCPKPFDPSSMVASSSSSSVPFPRQPQVFIIFRGRELRKAFISHLEKALKREGNNFFIDKDETKGNDLALAISEGRLRWQVLGLGSDEGEFINHIVEEVMIKMNEAELWR